MRAMQFDGGGSGLHMIERAIPEPGPDEILIEVAACGVCRTDLHILDRDIEGKIPIVPGHEIVGKVIETGEDVSRFSLGDRVGVPWLGSTCGQCRYCMTHMENLCDDPGFTGFTVDGGYATHAVARADYCIALPPGLDDAHAAPLLCAGLIGYRAFSLTNDAHRIGLYGFGASAHIIAQLATGLGCEIAAFTKPGDVKGQGFALSLGCIWAGGSDEAAPFELDAAIIFAPVGSLVPTALAAIRKGGTVVCAGIHMSDIPAFPYALIWGERQVRSVANLTRADGESFFAAVGEIKVEAQVERFALEDANVALDRLRRGDIVGAAVLIMQTDQERGE
ncbi:zinc-dependent alcohol dehydrogenase family protein [Erythrobacter insulae]|uniref:alcohol dehydrogenase n=2 Tax=Erythrobacter insulae TaxID=2584124 RepID=A0A547PF41_9SPHN|nr:zinc-dependent alcohol dehydrogenase family protein [Erythrobacter insulae]